MARYLKRPEINRSYRKTRRSGLRKLREVFEGGISNVKVSNTLVGVKSSELRYRKGEGRDSKYEILSQEFGLLMKVKCKGWRVGISVVVYMGAF